ncbi:MAG: PhnD/SsuA/transferrin family substrate-binding protein [bacterium]|nr:PhnD/SsuA/transferrin family substrate-binding protein [Candidatus Thioglobus pontius]
MRRLKFLFAALCFGLSLSTAAKNISIAVLAFSGEEYARTSWQPTVDYLNAHILKHRFNLVPIEPSNIEYLDQLVQQQKVDFIITQPVTFVELQVKYGATSILTLVDASKSSEFGSVIFSRSDGDIVNLSHIRGKSIAGANPKGLGGWLIGYNELKQHNVDVMNQSKVSFLGVQENIVRRVLDGSVDVGIVRTGVLERLSNSKNLDLTKLRVLNQKKVKDFPYLLSTSLYPEWAFVKAGHTSKLIAKQVASTLLLMTPGSKEAVARGYWEWVTPVNYQPIHDLMKSLRVGVYQDFGKVSFVQYIKDNLILSSMFFAVLMVLIMTGLWILRLNHQLKITNYFIEQQNNMILDSVSEGIYGVDLEGKCTFINQALTNITGWEKQDMLGKFQHEILHHTYADGTPHPSDQCPVYKTFKDGKARFIDKDTFWKKNGQSISVEYSTTPIKGKLGNIVGSVVVFRDVTQQIEHQKLQKQYEQDLEHVSRLNTMGEIVTGIAHELNQPLTVISTMAFTGARLVKSKQYDTDKFLDIFSMLSKQAEHAASVIKHMRKMSNKERSDYALININARIKGVITLLQSLIKDNNIQLTLDLDQTLPLVSAQAVQIDQVVLNLCKNAIDAMDDSDRHKILGIKTRCLDKMIEVTITDTGNGIDPEIVEHLFDPFSTFKKNGMGMGLSISRSIIERHYGSLYVAKSKHNMTTFKFTLPIKAPHE